ncbi:MAG: peptide ABC transporter substrate-binding protein [Candidatus Marinimicrobia bacterium]|nr:peptide ABC transporter substrate-binding protein [Candidatus Neomarinimicrobiota bacterium]|tara:strand:+ start:2802 stop:4457 length:1656 start_codon:yes stop_codon:yes gene_type:complete
MIKIFKNITISTILIIFFCCSNQEKDTSGLVISQEQRASWSRNFNPLQPGSMARFPTSAGIYEPLMIYNSMKGEYIPWLATNHYWNDSNDILTLDIRKDVNWSDGEIFSASDVLFTFKLLKSNPALDTRAIWSYLKDVILINDYEIQIVFSSVYVPGLDAIAGQTIVPQHIWTEIDDPVKFTNPNPVGTGPFTEIIKFQNQVWELGKNPNYWQTGKPKVEKLVFPAFPTNTQATYAITNGEVDWAGSFIPDIDQVYVRKDPENHHYWFPSTGGSIFLYPNHNNQHLKNDKFRKAISHAINREQIVKIAMNDYTVPAHITALSEVMNDWKGNTAKYEDWTEFDINKSINFLNELGYKINPKTNLITDEDNNTIPFEIIVVSGWSDWLRAGQIISRNLKEIGIDANVRTYDFGAWFDRLRTGQFDLAIAWAEKGNTPYNMYRGLMASEYVKPVGESSDLNWHRYGNKNVDLLCEKFIKTSNEKEIRDIILDMQKIFIENIPAIPLFAEPNWGQYNSTRFTNFPNKDNPYAALSPNNMPEALLVLVELEPVKIK